MNILFIGNSYTYFNDLPAVFSSLANENGKNVTAHSVTRGGRKLYQFTDADDDCTKELHTVLADNPPYDAVFMQEQSLLPYRDYDAFFKGAEHVARTVRAAGAKRLLFYVTWGRKPGCPMLDEMGWTHESMTAGLSDAYTRAAHVLDAECAYVGAAFGKIVAAHPEIELYDPDGSHPSYVGTCLAAMVMYRAVFGETAGKMESLKPGMDVKQVLIDVVR